jgi:hypothetical protein
MDNISLSTRRTVGHILKSLADGSSFLTQFNDSLIHDALKVYIDLPNLSPDGPDSLKAADLVERVLAAMGAASYVTVWLRNHENSSGTDRNSGFRCSVTCVSHSRSGPRTTGWELPRITLRLCLM